MFVAKDAKEAMMVPIGSIIVTHSTNKEFIPVLKRAIAIIAEEGGLTSHAAIVGFEMNIQVIVGVDNDMEMLRTGEEITVDTQ